MKEVKEKKEKEDGLEAVLLLKTDKCSTLNWVFLKDGCLVAGKNKDNHWEAWWDREEGGG